LHCPILPPLSSGGSKKLNFNYKIGKHKQLFGINHYWFTRDEDFTKHITKEYGTVVLPVPDNPNNLIEFYKSIKKAREKNIKNIVLRWNPPSWKTHNPLINFYYFMRKHILRKLFKKLDKIDTYCDTGKEVLNKKYKVPYEKISVSRNSLDNEKIEKKCEKFRKESKNKEKELGIKGKNKILFIGKITKDKNLKNLLLAIKGLEEKNNVLIIIGEGPFKKDVEGFAREEGIKNVLFLGKKVEDAEKYINVSDLVVLPGLGGLAVNHAMACSKPVITSPADKTPLDLIEDSVNGYILKKGSAEEIKDKIEKTIKNKNRLKKMGKKARISVKEKADLNDMVENFLKIIK